VSVDPRFVRSVGRRLRRHARGRVAARSSFAVRIVLPLPSRIVIGIVAARDEKFSTDTFSDAGWPASAPGVNPKSVIASFDCGFPTVDTAK